MHAAYERLSGIYATLEKELKILNANKVTIQALTQYEMSGLRKKDLDADNSGEIYVQDKYLDVLEDDNIVCLVTKARELHAQYGKFYAEIAAHDRGLL